MIDIAHLYDIYLCHPKVSTDTRQLPEGCLFFALKGASFDGNQFALHALENGAAYAVVDDPVVAQKDARMLLVEDTLRSLQQLARHHRRKFQIPVVAIGGSNGKTTTKELVSAVMSAHYPAHFTKGNLNNHIGVPLTLLAMPAETEIAIIEMGANGPGEIAELCAIAEPTHGLITNIGKEHLEGFGSLAGVKKAEGELFRWLAQTGGCGFVNRSEKYLGVMARPLKKAIHYGQKGHVRLGEDDMIFAEIELISHSPTVHAAFQVENGHTIIVDSHLFGRHNFHNIMTAIALGLYFKVPPAKIKSAIDGYIPSNNRSQMVRRGDNTWLMDAYNANPSSMEAALESFHHMKAPKKVAILGDMLEMGVESAKEHRLLLKKAARYGFDFLLLVGPEFGATDFAAHTALHFPDAPAAAQWLANQRFSNTCFLVKGSRGIRLERVLPDQ